MCFLKDKGRALEINLVRETLLEFLSTLFLQEYCSDPAEEAVPGPSVFPSREPGVLGDFWGSQEGCQGRTTW